MSGFSNYVNIDNIVTFHTLASTASDLQKIQSQNQSQNECILWAKRKAVLKNCKLSKTFRYKLKSSPSIIHKINKKPTVNKLQKYTKRYNLRTSVSH